MKRPKHESGLSSLDALVKELATHALVNMNEFTSVYPGSVCDVNFNNGDMDMKQSEKTEANSAVLIFKFIEELRDLPSSAPRTETEMCYLNGIEFHARKLVADNELLKMGSAPKPLPFRCVEFGEVVLGADERVKQIAAETLSHVANSDNKCNARS